MSTSATSLADQIEAAAFVDLFAAAPAELELRTHVESGATALIAPRLPVTVFNRVIGFGVSTAPTAAALAAITHIYDRAGVSTFWIHVGPDAHDDTEVVLRAAGLAPARRAAWIKVLRGTTPAPAISTPYAIEPAAAADGDGLAAALLEAFELPAVATPWLRGLVDRPGWHGYVARDDAEIVAGGFTFVQGEHAWLGLGGTRVAARGRGAQGALMARRIADALALGCVQVATETGEPPPGGHNPSLANMLRCGFAPVARRCNFERSAIAAATIAP